MNHLVIILSVCHFLISPSFQMQIPQDTEILDGYKIETPREALSPEESGYEGEQLDMLQSPDDMPIRDRRSPRYQVRESPGLRSHFHIDIDEVRRSLDRLDRNRRELEDIDKTRRELHSDEISSEDEYPRMRNKNIDEVSAEELPKAEKHTLNPSYYRTDEDRLMEKWVKSPYESRATKDETTGDTQAEASSNVGMNARQPRVNFITQQGQSSNNKDIPDGPEARNQNRDRDRDRDQDQNTKQSNDDSYNRKPSDEDHYYPSNYGNAGNRNSVYQDDTYNRPNGYNPYWDRNNYYPAYSERERDRLYDRYDRDRLYDRRYEMYMAPPPGMSMMQPPSYSNGNYYRNQFNDYDDYYPRSIPSTYYSDKRLDPTMYPMEPRQPPVSPVYDRDYRPHLYSNDVYGNDRYPPSGSSTQNTGRIIYYAHLPEITRAPPNVNLRYGTGDRYGTVAKRYDPSYDYYYNNYNRRTTDDYRDRFGRMVKASPLKDTSSKESAPLKVTSAPLPIRAYDRYAYQDRPHYVSRYH